MKKNNPNTSRKKPVKRKANEDNDDECFYRIFF